MRLATASNLLQLLGVSFDVWGALALANGYLSAVQRRDVLRILWSALWSGSAARGASELSVVSPEKRLESLRGLALIGLGFLLQAVGAALALLAPSSPR